MFVAYAVANQFNAGIAKALLSATVTTVCMTFAAHNTELQKKR